MIQPESSPALLEVVLGCGQKVPNPIKDPAPLAQDAESWRRGSRGAPAVYRGLHAGDCGGGNGKGKPAPAMIRYPVARGHPDAYSPRYIAVLTGLPGVRWTSRPNSRAWPSGVILSPRPEMVGGSSDNSAAGPPRIIVFMAGGWGEAISTHHCQRQSGLPGRGPPRREGARGRSVSR